MSARASHGAGEPSLASTVVRLFVPAAVLIGPAAMGHLPTALMSAGLWLAIAGGYLRATWRAPMFGPGYGGAPLPGRRSSMAEAGHGRYALIGGRVVRAEGEVRGPSSGRSGFFLRLEFEVYDPPTRFSRGRWRSVGVEHDSVPFWVADDSGYEAKIAGFLEVDPEARETVMVDSSSGVTGLPRALQRRVEGNEELATALGDAKSIRVLETVGVLGAQVAVAGHFRSGQEGPYRDASQARVLVREARGFDPKEPPRVFLGSTWELRSLDRRPALHRALLTVTAASGALCVLLGLALARHPR